MLECSDKTFYVGVTSNLHQRLYEHRTGFYPKSYTHNRRPVKLAYYSILHSIHEAIAWEKQIKKWGQNKKKALIEGDWDKVSKFARSSS